MLLPQPPELVRHRLRPHPVRAARTRLQVDDVDMVNFMTFLMLTSTRPADYSSGLPPAGWADPTSIGTTDLKEDPRMPTVQISETADTGEVRWGVSLIDDQGTVTLRAANALTAGVASSTAKALVHKGPDAPTVHKPPGDDRPAWYVEEVDGQWLARFTLVSETEFDLLLKPDDSDPKAAELALERVKRVLAKAEVKWVPPEADPAYEHKATDVTPTKGHPGS